MARRRSSLSISPSGCFSASNTGSIRNSVATTPPTLHLPTPTPPTPAPPPLRPATHPPASSPHPPAPSSPIPYTRPQMVTTPATPSPATPPLERTVAERSFGAIDLLQLVLEAIRPTLGFDVAVAVLCEHRRHVIPVYPAGTLDTPALQPVSVQAPPALVARAP